MWEHFRAVQSWLLCAQWIVMHTVHYTLIIALPASSRVHSLFPPVCPAHSRFRGSVNCGDPTMDNRFQVAKFLFEARKASSLFFLVQNGPGVTWVACNGLREHSKWSLGCERAFLEAFWTFLSHLGHTVPASCGHGIPKQIIVNGFLC